MAITKNADDTMIIRVSFVLRAAAIETNKRIREKPAKQARRNRSRGVGFTVDDSS